VSARSCLVAAVALLATGCAKKGPDLVQPVGETHTTASSTGGGRPQGTDVPTSPIGIVLAEDVQRACSLPQDRSHAPSFALDSARLRARGEDILAKVAACVVSGRLGDEPLMVIGHTDPRGAAAYNQQLGLYRAIAAKQYLVELGVPASRISTESHGERDAKGTDEASWALDRTVEVRIGRGPGDIPQ
jgi:peptidoglycan-associated lipoprotein